jgi:very-short-patch-repair endonuclease
VILDTLLARICRYYLECLSHEHLLARLREARSDPDRQESIDPHASSDGAGSPYTRGLESELRSLQSLEKGEYRATALGEWLSGRTIESPPADRRPLLEVLALNGEQRQAVRQALSNPLTVITGPPGTGKSQVVASILVNAARRGKTVLFASKNNKAVDLVETRVNALGHRPVLLRLGGDQYHPGLAEYLVSLPAATADADDRERYRELEIAHARLRQRSDSLDAELRSIVALRNEVDRLEQQVEPIRQELGEEVFHCLRVADHHELTRAAWLFRAAVDRATRARQSLLTRLVWRFVSRARSRRLVEARQSFQQFLSRIGLSNLPYANHLSGRASQVTAAMQYFGRLAALTRARSLEDLGGQWKELTTELAGSSRCLWQTWLRLQPSRTRPAERRLLADYGAVLRTIASADQHHQPGRDVLRRYHQLFPHIRSIVPCWAVTSLSVRGRVPFAPSFFDVLVIDEASQCDIASALPLLYRARAVAVIGDPMQLRHISALASQEDERLMSKHGLADDYGGWAYSFRSLFDLARSVCRNRDVVALVDHHRSHADIIEFSNRAFYGGRLRIATDHGRLRRPCLDHPPVRWVDIQGRTVRPACGGAMNEAEAQAVVKEIEQLVGQGYRGSLGVVSPFRAQANRIRDIVRGRDGLVTRLEDADFVADTVHRFQGDERDVIIFSPVVSPGVSEAALGFLRSHPNLFNVAISRARAALIVVGNRTAALSGSVDYLARFAVYSVQVGNEDESAVSSPGRASAWELVFEQALHRAGVRPLPRYRVDGYVLDLALLNGKRRLDIEIDSDHYHRNWDSELCRRQQIRTDRLVALGWDVMRFWVYQVRDDLDRSVERVQQWIQHPRSSPG